MKYFIYGGSFNPVTVAHVGIIEKILAAYPESKVIVVPCSINYKKSGLMPNTLRLSMLKAVFKDNERVIIDEIELNDFEYLGTLSTLKRLTEKYKTKPVFVMGADNALNIGRWINYKELLSEYEFLIFKRPGYQVKLTEAIKAEYIEFEMDVSASMIRNNPDKFLDFVPKAAKEIFQNNYLKNGCETGIFDLTELTNFQIDKPYVLNPKKNIDQIYEVLNALVKTGLNRFISRKDIILNSKSDLIFYSEFNIKALSYLKEKLDKIKELDTVVFLVNNHILNYSDRTLSFVEHSVFIDYHQFLKDKITQLKIENKNKILALSDTKVNYIISTAEKQLADKLTQLTPNKFVIGISGGLDSAITLLFAHLACKRLNVDPQNHIFPLILPSVNNKESVKRATELCKNLCLTPKIIEIDEICQSIFNKTNHFEKDVIYENTQARVRTLLLLNAANKVNGVVLNTSDLSEILLGFGTVGADLFGLFATNATLFKSEIKAVLAYLAKNQFYDQRKVIQEILAAPISPELLPNQNTEEILGNYVYLDQVLNAFCFQGKEFSIELIDELFGDKLSKAEKQKILNTVETRVFKNAFKRSAFPLHIEFFERKLTDFFIEPDNEYFK